MASAKKRPSALVSKEPSCLRPGRKERQRTNRRKTATLTNGHPQHDLLYRLPPELRNVIYKLVLVDNPGRSTYDGDIVLRYGRYRGSHIYNVNGKPIYKKGPRLRWRESALLQASKWIRKETKLLYYTSHTFAVKYTSHDIGPLCQWLRFLISDVDASSLLTRFKRVLTQYTWSDMPTWLPLAKLYRDVEAVGVLKIFVAEDLPVKRYSEQYHGLWQVARLGLQARTEDWDDAKLEKEFEDWAERVLAKCLPIRKPERRHAISLAMWKEKRKNTRDRPGEHHCEDCRSEAL
ncbi:hypothetical protein LTR86_002341 [Recurvomyces mirabilis]|nr:hypothetical protein LTR86_002341 [Recurvomyces mirabilis]